MVKNLKDRIREIKGSIRVKDVMSRNVVMLDKSKSVYDAVKLMTEKAISTIVVSDREKPVGIVTERDMVNRILLKEKNPRDVKLEEIMTLHPKTIEPNSSILRATNVMKNQRVRKLTVVDNNGNLVGILSQTDIIRSMNRVYDNYQHILWNPWFAIIIFVLISVLFIIDILLLK